MNILNDDTISDEEIAEETLLTLTTIKEYRSKNLKPTASDCKLIYLCYFKSIRSEDLYNANRILENLAKKGAVHPEGSVAVVDAKNKYLITRCIIRQNFNSYEKSINSNYLFHLPYGLQFIP